MTPVLVEQPLGVEKWVKHARKYGGLQTVFRTAARSRSLDAGELLTLASELTKLSSWKDRSKLSRDLKNRLIELVKEG